MPRSDPSPRSAGDLVHHRRVLVGAHRLLHVIAHLHRQGRDRKCRTVLRLPMPALRSPFGWHSHGYPPDSVRRRSCSLRSPPSPSASYSWHGWKRPSTSPPPASCAAQGTCRGAWRHAVVLRRALRHRRADGRPAARYRVAKRATRSAVSLRGGARDRAGRLRLPGELLQAWPGPDPKMMRLDPNRVMGIHPGDSRPMRSHSAELGVR